MSDTLDRLQRLEAQYAELAAKVDAMTSNDDRDHVLPEETPAQQRYREASERYYSNREVEMAAGAFDRAEEVAQELDDWTHLIHMRLNTMSSRIGAGEPPPAPDPVCQSCKHLKTSHTERKCHHTHVAEGPDGWQTMHCGCMGFLDVPAAEPEPAALVPRAEVKNAIEALRTDAKYFSHQCLELHRVNRRNSIADALEKLLGDGKDGAR